MRRKINSREKEIFLHSGEDVEKRFKMAKQLSKVKTLFGVVLSGSTVLLGKRLDMDAHKFISTLSAMVRTLFTPEALNAQDLINNVGVDYLLIGARNDLKIVEQNFANPLVLKEYYDRQVNVKLWLTEWAKVDKSLIGFVNLLRPGGKIFQGSDLNRLKVNVKDVLVTDEFSPLQIMSRLLDSQSTSFDTIITTEGKTGFWSTFYTLQTLQENGFSVPKEVIVIRDSMPALFKAGFVSKTIAEDICFEIAIHDLVRVYDSSLPENTRFVLIPQTNKTMEFIIISLLSRKITEILSDTQYTILFDNEDWDLKEISNFETKCKNSPEGYWLPFYPSKKTPVTSGEIKELPDMVPRKRYPQRPVIVRTFAFIEKAQLDNLLDGDSINNEVKAAIWASIKKGLGLIGFYQTEKEFRDVIHDAIYFSTMSIYVPHEEYKDTINVQEVGRIYNFVQETIQFIGLPNTPSRIFLTPVLDEKIDINSQKHKESEYWIVSFDLYIDPIYLIDSVYRLSNPFRMGKYAGGGSMYYERSKQIKEIIRKLLPGAIYVSTRFTGMTGEIPALLHGLFKRNHAAWRTKTKPSWSERDTETTENNDLQNTNMNIQFKS